MGISIGNNNKIIDSTIVGGNHEEKTEKSLDNKTITGNETGKRLGIIVGIIASIATIIGVIVAIFQLIS